MVVPYQMGMPRGGVRQYGGQPVWGTWNKYDGRFTTTHKGRTYKVHRLVCEAFHGLPTEESPYCLHIDENAANNKAENLKWGSQKENLNAPGFIAYCKTRTGENHPKAKGLKLRGES